MHLQLASERFNQAGESIVVAGLRSRQSDHRSPGNLQPCRLELLGQCRRPQQRKLGACRRPNL